MNNSEKIWNALSASRVDKVVYLPCNKLNQLMLHVPDNVEVINISRESAGVGLCFGRTLAGKRTAMMIQNTGLGNLITELFTLHKLYQEALPIFVSWRGYHQEPIEAQVIFGSKIEDLLAAIDIEFAILKHSEDLASIVSDVAACYEQNKIKVFLMSPELWETNNPDYHDFGNVKLDRVSIEQDEYDNEPTLNRMDAIKVIMDAVSDDDIVVPQIGFPAKEVYNAKDRPLNFYMLGALGSATEVGIGLASEVGSRHVYVIDGDGSIFFSPNQLLDLASLNPQNLTVICLDNGSWGSTGNQPTLSSSGFNISAMVRSIGIQDLRTTDDPSVLEQAVSEKPRFLHYMIRAGNDKTGDEIPIKAVDIKNRFMGALGVPQE